MLFVCTCTYIGAQFPSFMAKGRPDLPNYEPMNGSNINNNNNSKNMNQQSSNSRPNSVNQQQQQQQGIPNKKKNYFIGIFWKAARIGKKPKQELRSKQ